MSSHFGPKSPESNKNNYFAPKSYAPKSNNQHFKSGRRNTFDIEEMFVLRRAGWTYHRLARAYNVDHSTILYHCKKHKVEPETDARISVEPKIPARVGRKPKDYIPPMPVYQPETRFVYQPKPVTISKYDDLMTENINHGKRYEHYLKIEKAKPKVKVIPPWIKNYMKFTPNRSKGKIYIPKPMNLKHIKRTGSDRVLIDDPYVDPFIDD